MRIRPCLLESLIAFSIAALCVLVAILTLGYDAVPIRIPAAYDGDGIYYGMLIKGVIDSGWYLHNPWLGAPFGLDMGPFPMVDDTHFAMIRVLGLLTGEFGATLTMFTLGTYATAAISAYAVMRLLGLNKAYSAVGAFLFSIQAYHFWRGAHLFLDSYFSVPVYVGIAMALYRRPANRQLRWITLLGTAALLLVVSGTGVYYAFFGSVLIGFASIAASIEQRRWQPLALGTAAGFVILLSTLGNLAPHLASIHRHVDDEVITERKPSESELYGLRFIQMAMPSQLHRRAELRQKAKLYEKNAPNVNENATASLGLIALSGFILSILAMLVNFGFAAGLQLRRFGTLNAVAFGYATIGGVGTVFAWLVSAQFRGLNRISIFIAFISLCALLLVIQTLGQKIASIRLRRGLTALLALLIVVLGFWDQVPAWTRMNLAHVNQAGFERDEASGKAIERALPAGARVYQLPYVSFPEAPPIFREGSHGLARRYLHTHGIAWSFGAMRGRESDQWIQTMESLPLRERLARLAAADFDAILVERAAYADSGQAIEREISALAGPPTLICPDQSCALFDLGRTRTDSVRPLLLAVRGQGFRAWQPGPDGKTMTESTGRTSRLFLLNPLKRPVEARLRFAVSAKTGSTLFARIGEKELLTQELDAGRDQPFNSTINLDPGITTLALSVEPTSATHVDSSADGFVLTGVHLDTIGTPEQERELRDAEQRQETIFSDRETPQAKP